MDVGAIMAIVPVVILVAFIVLLVKRKLVDGSSGMDMRGVIGVLAVVMVAVLLTASIPSSTDDGGSGDFELYDCVPASDFGSDVTVTGDSAELVEIGGTEYVRMKDIGSFRVSADGLSASYKVGKAHMDLVLLTGQSNSVFYTNPEYYPDPSPVAPGKAFYLGSDDVQSFFGGVANPSDLEYSGVMDLVADDGSVRLAQMYPAFCSGYVQETGHRVFVVNTGIGGMGISAWQDGGRCDLWMKAVFDRLSEVTERSISFEGTVALWSQGEADKDLSVQEYKAGLLSLLDRLWDGDYGFAFPHVLSCLPRYPGYGTIPPAEAQMQIASSHSGFSIASTLPLRFGDEQTRDGIHYTQEVYGWLGEAFARSAASALGDSPVQQSIVMAEDVGQVSSLPSRVTAWGTSGEAFSLSASWTETSTPGEYEAALSGNPQGTTIAPGLEAKANLI